MNRSITTVVGLALAVAAFLCDASGSAADETCRCRIHYQYRIQCRNVRVSPAFCLCGCQMGVNWFDQDLGNGTGPGQYTGKRPVPRER